MNEALISLPLAACSASPLFSPSLLLCSAPKKSIGILALLLFSLWGLLQFQSSYSISISYLVSGILYLTSHIAYLHHLYRSYFCPVFAFLLF